MPRVTIRQAKTETLREILETEFGHWGHLGPPERLKQFISDIETELWHRHMVLTDDHHQSGCESSAR
jgi:hypothetical protein